MLKRKGLIAAALCGVMLLTACSGGGESESINDTGISVPVSSGDESVISSDESSQSTSEDQSSMSEDPLSSSGDPSGSSEDPASTPQSSDPITSDPEVTSSKAALIYCVDDRKTIFSENADDPIAIASITKVLTACVALNNMDPETVITVGTEQNLVKPGSSICFIAKGQRLKLKDLISGMMIASGNDAAYTVAVAVARARDPQKTLTDEQAVDEFADMMNSFAKQLGMNHSHFVNPEGWDDPRQYTTASDLLLLAEYALTVPEIRENAATYQKKVVYVSGENAVWTNSNKLLDSESRFYNKNAVGLKTGTTNQAGCCLLAAFEREGKTYISVVAGCESDNERYELTKELFDMC
ncbi:MAG: serine hydrolase [Oscillospiraceae bacterium]|nr:serine hydrolase [Oscillospiraceae bacterium]